MLDFGAHSRNEEGASLSSFVGGSFSACVEHDEDAQYPYGARHTGCRFSKDLPIHHHNNTCRKQHCRYSKQQVIPLLHSDLPRHVRRMPTNINSRCGCRKGSNNKMMLSFLVRTQNTKKRRWTMIQVTTPARAKKPTHTKQQVLSSNFP